MRDWRKWHADLVQSFLALRDMPLSQKECQRLFEVEYCLRFGERFAPQTSCLDIWTLFTGYTVEGITDEPRLRRMCVYRPATATARTGPR